VTFVPVKNLHKSHSVTNFGKKSPGLYSEKYRIANLLHGEMKQLILLQITANESALFTMYNYGHIQE